MDMTTCLNSDIFSDTPEVMYEKKSSNLIQERQEWVKAMRLEFSQRPEFPITLNMILEDGSLNQA
jgi:hypothetical protein